jgi:hypothetical protein
MQRLRKKYKKVKRGNCKAKCRKEKIKGNLDVQRIKFTY